MKIRYQLLSVISLIVIFFACKQGASPAELRRASLALADGSPISQTTTDEYNPYIVKMSDGYLMLVFGSDRSCGGCTAGTHNIFVARSVAAYNNDQKIPAFNAPVVMTIAATPLNYSSAVTFAATSSGTNLRIFLNNTLGIIQYADFSPAGPTYNAASLTSIVNSIWRKTTIVGIDDTGTGIYARSSSGSVYWFNPAIINITLTAMTGTGYTTVARVAPAQSGIQDGYLTLANGTVSAASYASAGSTLTKLQTTISNSKVTAKSISIAHTGNQTGDFIVLSASDVGKTLQDLYLADGMTPAQLWAEVNSKPASGIASLPAAASDIYAWYELDGGRTDASGAGNHGLLTMGGFTGIELTYTATDRNGTANAAASFNGTNQYFVNSFLAKCDQSFSVSMWIKPAQIAAQRSLMGFQVSAGLNPGFTLNAEAGGGVATQSFFVADGNNVDNTYAVSAAGLLAIGQWAHFAYVNDSATRSATLYVNGAVVATTTHVNGGPLRCSGSYCTCSGVSPVSGVQQWYSATPLTIGYAYRGYFSGVMDQIAIFNRKLTVAEIQTLATQ